MTEPTITLQLAAATSPTHISECLNDPQIVREDTIIVIDGMRKLVY